MKTEDILFNIKRRIYELYISKSEIHIIVMKKRRSTKIKEIAHITEVYDKFFTVSSKVGYYDETFTITFIDLLIKEIIIEEIDINELSI